MTGLTLCFYHYLCVSSAVHPGYVLGPPGRPQGPCFNSPALFSKIEANFIVDGSASLISTSSVIPGVSEPELSSSDSALSALSGLSDLSTLTSLSFFCLIPFFFVAYLNLHRSIGQYLITQHSLFVVSCYRSTSYF